MATQKRFIAGAICPRCAEMDRIRSWEQNGVRYRDCVSCDFFEQLPIEEETPPELETRLSQPREAQTSQPDDLQTVRILDPYQSR
ncbi:YheV family putative zinc ribbon protein [Halomonas sp. I1]|uniref:YheV family putative zinc ribbon protein n=1 Tax=Halomonas sp. I1 TaxID=393536 RepID=UPI0028DD94B2|nr:YheV family putative zinc ribbon protein [Halomonas sp. I1]MDT8893027.1 YheV family putative zinc ribbon protein [Halomonas sp. I1]